MLYENQFVIHDSHGPHRDTEYDKLASTPGVHYHIDGMRLVIVRLTMDNKWWVVPDSMKYEDHFTDLGPYDTISDACIILRLSAEVMDRNTLL